MAQIIKRQNGYSVREFYMYKGKKKSKNQGGFKTKKEAQNYAIELDHKKLNHELMAETEIVLQIILLNGLKTIKNLN